METGLAHTKTRSARTSEDPLQPLVARIAAGDEDALCRLYEATSSRVFGLSLQILRDRPAAEEALVEVYAQVWRQADRHDPGKGSVATWIATLARTRSIDLARARQRRSQRESVIDIEQLEVLKDPAPGPLEVSHDSERAALVRAALESLPREQKIAVEAAFFGGLSHSEVARALGEPLGTIKTRIRSGLLKLKQSLSSGAGN